MESMRVRLDRSLRNSWLWIKDNWRHIGNVPMVGVFMTFFATILIASDIARAVVIGLMGVTIIVGVTVYAVFKEIHLPDLDGDWFCNGDSSKVCSIMQRPGGVVEMTNEKGEKANGLFNKHHIFTGDWTHEYRALIGTFADDERRINWDNGTSWTKAGKRAR